MLSNAQDIQPGWTAYDQADEKIGEVAEVGRNYVLVQKGLFFPSDIYIPLSSVTSADTADQSVTVNVAKSQVESMGWDSPPVDDDMASQADVSSTSGYDTGATARGTAGTTTTDDSFTVPLREERLEAERREREAGEVTVGKHVNESEQAIDVPVTHEEVEVTRRRVDRPADSDGGIVDDGETIRVPIRAEEVDVRKDARVVEEVEISKRPVTETQRVSETVRREEIDVNTSGDVLTGAGSRASRADLDDESVSSGARLDDESDPYRS
jgi:uncharacterized protein (TIGR02271 family)